MPVPLSVVHRRIEADDDAAAAVGGDAHEALGRKAELLHQRGVEPDGKPRAVAEFIRKMIDGRMHMRNAAMRVTAVRMS